MTRLLKASRNGGSGPHIDITDDHAVRWLKRKVEIAKPGDVFTLTVTDVEDYDPDNEAEMDFDD